ncbi:MAG TPA: arylsulfatase, partial [Chitinophagaceae bacterium]|nr:arylsulfatase [Chitinophagaceae bacterium]
WPDHIPAGTVCNKIASTIDLLPTITKIANAALPERKIDGINILPLLLGEPDANPRKEFVYYYQRNSLEAIRQDKWKLVFPHKSRSYKAHPPGHDGFPGPTSQIDVPLALYDLSTDPGETMDVQQLHPDVVKQMEALADKYREDMGDDLTHVEGTGRRPAGVCDACKTNIRKP